VPLGRKSWLFSGSDRSGQRAAIASCIGIGAPICTKSQPVRTASRPSAYAYCSSTEK
jgi:hypothetical protein